MISIHALLAESDSELNSNWISSMNFYPRSPCGERPLLSSFIIVYVKISIHALLAESDCFRIPYWFKVTISIHALLAESDDNLTQGVFNLFTFLSTLSLRRATPRGGYLLS